MLSTKRPRNIAFIVFALLAFIFLMGFFGLKYASGIVRSELTQPLDWAGDLCKDLAVMLGAVVVLEYLWSTLGGDPLARQIEKLAELTELHSDGQKTGLKRLKIGEPAPDWLAFIRKCQQSIELAGYMLHPFGDNPEIRKALAERATHGVKIRILLFNPTNPALQHIVNPTDLDAMISMMKLNYRRFVESQPTDKRFAKNYDVAQLQHGVLDFSYYRFDNEIHVVNYLYKVETPASPVLVIRGDSKVPLFRLYEGAFDGLFKLAKSGSPPFPPAPTKPGIAPPLIAGASKPTGGQASDGAAGHAKSIDPPP